MDTPSVINSSFFPDIVYLNGSRLKEVVEVHLLLCQLHRTNEVRLLQCALLAGGSQSRLLIPSMCIGSLSKLPFILYTSFFFMYPSEHVLWNSSSSRNHTRPSCGL